MNKFLKILAIILIMLFVSAPSCMDEQEIARQEEVRLNAEKDEIRMEFEKEYLTETELFAYETTAKQKLSDFADYLNILADTSLNLSFREKASEMINTTFQSENVKLRLALMENNPDKELNIRRINRMGINNKLSHLSFSFDSLLIHDPLRRTVNYNYSGTLKFLQKFLKPNKSDHILKSYERTADFYVVKEYKVFGMDTLNVWNVQLGEIR